MEPRIDTGRAKQHPAYVKAKQRLTSELDALLVEIKQLEADVDDNIAQRKRWVFPDTQEQADENQINLLKMIYQQKPPAEAKVGERGYQIIDIDDFVTDEEIDAMGQRLVRKLDVRRQEIEAHCKPKKKRKKAIEQMLAWLEIQFKQPEDEKKENSSADQYQAICCLLAESKQWLAKTMAKRNDELVPGLQELEQQLIQLNQEVEIIERHHKACQAKVRNSWKQNPHDEVKVENDPVDEIEEKIAAIQKEIQFQQQQRERLKFQDGRLKLEAPIRESQETLSRYETYIKNELAKIDAQEAEYQAKQAQIATLTATPDMSAMERVTVVSVLESELPTHKREQQRIRENIKRLRAEKKEEEEKLVKARARIQDDLIEKTVCVASMEEFKTDKTEAELVNSLEQLGKEKEVLRQQAEKIQNRSHYEGLKKLQQVLLKTKENSQLEIQANESECRLYQEMVTDYEQDKQRCEQIQQQRPPVADQQDDETNQQDQEPRQHQQDLPVENESQRPAKPVLAKKLNLDVDHYQKMHDAFLNVAARKIDKNDPYKKSKKEIMAIVKAVNQLTQTAIKKSDKNYNVSLCSRLIQVSVKLLLNPKDTQAQNEYRVLANHISASNSATAQLFKKNRILQMILSVLAAIAVIVLTATAVLSAPVSGGSSLLVAGFFAATLAKRRRVPQNMRGVLNRIAKVRA